MRFRLQATVVLLTALTAGGTARAGTLPLAANLTFFGSPACETCSDFSLSGHGVVRGMGDVRFSGTGNTDTSNTSCGRSTEQLTITAPEGTVALAAVIDGCSTPFSATFEQTTAEFTVAAGTGRFQGITGAGVLRSNGSAAEITGNLDAPSYTFDLVPPTFRGVVSHKAKSSGPTGARVTFKVSARDAVDGAVRVSCDHRSGSVFPIGATTVTCSASDSALNVAHARFVVKVTRP